MILGLLLGLCGFIGINADDIIAEWYNGSNTDRCIDPGSLQTTVMFECGPYATWVNQGVGVGEATAYLKDFFVNFEDPCQVSQIHYEVIFNFEIFLTKN